MLPRKDLHWLYSAPFFLGYACLAAVFVWHDGISTFASDSANYVLMARYLSPWLTPSEAIVHAWPWQDFPPLFPLVLALTGAAHSLPAAHLLTLAFFLAAIPLVAVFSRHILGNPGQALFVTALFMVSPSSWINIMGILSEPLYLCLTMLFLVLLPRLETGNRVTALWLGLLLALIILTRSIGIAMLVAYGVHAVVLFRRKEPDLLKLAIPAIVAIACLVLANVLLPAALPNQYLNLITSLSLDNQFRNLYESWLTSWQFYWTDDQIASMYIFSACALLSLGGLCLRLRQGKADAVYALGYLVILLVWPFPGQLVRFLFPVLPLLLPYSLVALKAIVDKWPQVPGAKVSYAWLALLLAVVLPAQAFLYFRYQAGSDSGFNHITEFYNLADLSRANSYAGAQVTMFDDLRAMSDATPETTTILYFEPTFVALLADRRSDYLLQYFTADGNFEYPGSPGETLVYLSRINPRNSSPDLNSLNFFPAIIPHGTLVWAHASPVSDETVSALIQLN